jgi:hypothetical protein
VPFVEMAASSAPITHALSTLTLHKKGRIMVVESSVEEFDGQESDTGSG